jgi:hypothetical protein
LLSNFYKQYQGGWIQQTKTYTGEATLAGAGGVLRSPPAPNQNGGLF